MLRLLPCSYPRASFLLLTLFLNVAFAQDEHRHLYENDELYHQLSGSAQNLMRAKFGLRPGETRLGAQETGKAFEAGLLLAAPEGSSPLTPLVNTLVNNAAADATAQDTQSETSIVLVSGSTIVVGFNDSGSFIGGASKFTGFSRSTDGGATWVDGGTLPTNATGDAGDPVLARNNTTGRLYLATLQFSGNGIAMFRSDDNGATWMAPTQAAPGATGFQDKEWITVDNFAGTGQGNVYHAYRDFATAGGVRFSRSTDHGATFTPSPGLMIKAAGASNVQGAWVTVGTDHSVYVFWYDQNFTPRQIRMRKSTDQGVTFGAEVSVATLEGMATNGDLGFGTFRSNSFPQVVVNPVSSNLYLTYNDNPAGADRADVFFKQSTDGGTTWTSAVKVNADATTNDQWQPAIAVRPDGTGLAISWYDRRSDPVNNLIERWGATATITGATVTFGTNFRMSPQFPVVVGVDPVINPVYMGDYDQLEADNSFYYSVWGDNRDQSVAVPSRKNANVRFAKFPQEGPGPILDFVSATLTGGNGNGSLDSDECNALTITLKNSGTSSATGITTRLLTSTAHVSLPDSLSTYPTIAAGASATNTTSFNVSTSLLFSCGNPASVTMIATSSAGTDTFQIPLASSGAGQFHNITPTPIPDNNTAGVEIPIVVSGITAAITDVNVSFHITHTWDSDLNIRLIGPDNTIINLINRRGGSGDNFGTSCATRTILDDAAGTAISAGTAPFAGTYRPEQLLSTFNGKSGSAVNGTWKLRVNDTVAVDVGTVQCWSITISPASCPSGGGSCEPVPIQLASFTGRWIGGSTVALQWTTLSEIDNYGFEIQRSEESTGPFETIPGSFVPGNGTTLEPKHYEWNDRNAQARLPYYRLKQIDFNGSVNYFDPIHVSMLTGVPEQSLPVQFVLMQNYPNPFNPTTTIRYGLPEDAEVRLEVFNTLGQRVALLAGENTKAGYHEATFDASALATGVYLYKLTAGRFVDSKKLLLIK